MAGDNHYQLRIVTRCRVANLRLRPGSLLTVAPDKLRVCAHLVRNGAARPADRSTALDIELFHRLNERLPERRAQ